MFFAPLTLLNISHLREPDEVVPLGERNAFAEGLNLLEDGAFKSFEKSSGEGEALQLKITLLDSGLKKNLNVRAFEVEEGGAVHFYCENCKTSAFTPEACRHQWAAFTLIWRGLTLRELGDSRLMRDLAEDLKGPLFVSSSHQGSNITPTEKPCELESISLFLEDHPLLGGESLTSLFTESLGHYKLQEVSKEQEALSPLLWNMPEVFRRKLSAYSEHYFNEVNEQNRLAGLVRYNFSDGSQISAKEILRHPLHKSVPRHLLPQAKTQNSLFSQWPLTSQVGNLFVSQNIRELELIMQGLLANIATQVRQGRLPLYLQSKNSREGALLVKNISFDAAVEFEWRVEFVEKRELITELKLINSNKRDYAFFESFAFDPGTGTLVVHPWQREWKELETVFNKIAPEFGPIHLERGATPTLRVEGEIEAKSLLKHLRARTIPVKITGESITLEPQQSQTDLNLEETGLFFIAHRARILGQKDLVRRGWTPRTVLFLKTLSDGLPYLLNSEAKDVASRARGKRDWDLKLLKHLGILQYLFLETLSYHFDGALTDGRIVDKKDIFPLLQEKIQKLLVSGTGVVLARDMSLSELCSKSVLTHFEEFIAKTLESLNSSESFYSEQGEVILKGVVEREFRLLYEILKYLALSTGGEAFKKSRTTLLSKIWTGDIENDGMLISGLFHLPRSKDEDVNLVHETLEMMQGLLTENFQIFFKGQALQELSDEDFQVDFNLQSNMSQGHFNWFELNPRFFLKGQEIDPQEMGNFGSGGVIEHDGKLYVVPRKQMPSLRRLENFWRKLQKGKKESSQKFGGEKIYHLPRHQVLELLALRSSGYGIRGDEEWKKLCDFYDQLGKSERTIQVPKTIKADLKPYQAQGFQWLQDLYNLKLGALLADDMGLGKTLQTLTFLESLRAKKELRQVLIVVPSSLIFNWQTEVEKFTPQIPLTVFSSKDMDKIGRRLELKEELVVITTYGLLMENEAFLSQYQWQILIFDEAQNLKNITTKRTSSARSLKAQFKICLTGTPMENHYGEFYSLVDLLVPGSLGKIEDFRRQFVNTDIVSREEIEDLKLKIKPLLLRRTKKEILDQLPEKQETKVSIAFEEQQKEIYRDIALAYNQKVQDSLLTQGETAVQLQMLTALLRLRQACSDPANLPNIRYDKVPPKLEALMDSLEEIVSSGESALVFTQFLQTLEHTEKILKAANIPVFVLHGGVPTKQRQKVLSDFNKVEGGAVLVMTLKTGGVGLNLTKASYVFHLEPWWNPSVENQATDRAHRIGQNKAVQVFRYIMHESLEEKIELLKNRKDSKFKSLFATPEKESEIGPGSGALTKEDFDLLLGLK
ncbi:DEAD/DEAH box helicase [Bdellovibrio bacteriovorus]